MVPVALEQMEYGPLPVEKHELQFNTVNDISLGTVSTHQN